MDELRPGDTFAGFHIWRRLGQGGMGTVYAARHPRLPRDVALKLLIADRRDAAAAARFDREAETIARLDHPGIVSVLDRGDEGGIAWISMQLVEGRDAASELAQHGPLAVADATSYVRQVAEALDVAHRQGVIHRDVKPANIMLTEPRPGQPRRALLTDFGIAALTSTHGHSDITGRLDGGRATAAFASPEQLRGAPLDGRSDQYSLACTLFTLLTGEPPYPGATGAEVGRGHLSGPVPSVRTSRPEVPSTVAAALERAMSKEPEARFASCSQFAEALTPPPRGRRPLAVAIVAGILAVGLAAAALAWNARADDQPAARQTATVTTTSDSPAKKEAALWRQAQPALQLWPRLLPKGPRSEGYQNMICQPSDEPSAATKVRYRYILKCVAREEGYDKPSVTIDVLSYAPGKAKEALEATDPPPWVPRVPSSYLVQMYHFDDPTQGDWILLAFPGGERSEYHMQIGSKDGQIPYRQLYDWVLDAPL